MCVQFYFNTKFYNKYAHSVIYSVEVVKIVSELKSRESLKVIVDDICSLTSIDDSVEEICRWYCKKELQVTMND